MGSIVDKVDKTHRWERISGRLLFWSLTSALAGFLFGFDTVVISGAEQQIQALWSLTPAVHGMAMASTLYGTVVGAMLGAWPTDWFGRRPTLIAIGLLYIVSAIWSALAGDVQSFIVARLIGGLGIGVSTVAAPLYISEIAPPRYRGMLAGSFQFNIVFGICIAYLSNALLASIGEDAWRWMLGVAAIPSALYTTLSIFIPESPRWLLTKRQDRSAGLAVLRLIQPSASADQIDGEADEIVSSSRQMSNGPFWSKSLSKPILLAFLVAFFNQLSGINALLYFAPRIFEMAGLAKQAAMLQSVGIGVTIATFTFAGIWLIDHMGRRTLLIIGSWGYIASLALISWAFFAKQFALIPFGIFAFVAAHAVGQGTVIWVLIAEVFPNEHRAAGQALGSSTHWVFAALITTFFPIAASLVAPGFIFAFFCLMMVLQLVWVKVMVPETKGVPLELMQNIFR
jgi:MFS transporter, SP family, arabinose:H+ symporter